MKGKLGSQPGPRPPRYASSTRPNTLVGLVVGRLTVLKQHPRMYVALNGNTMSRWICRCECGTRIVVARANLKGARTKSCGCLRRELCAKVGRENKTHHGITGMHNLQGRRFFRLTVISRARKSNAYGQVRWNCRCRCGKKTVVSGRILLSHGQKSCGCLRREMTAKLGRRRGRR